jgi:hypothetical protein
MPAALNAVFEAEQEEPQEPEEPVEPPSGLTYPLNIAEFTLGDLSALGSIASAETPAELTVSLGAGNPANAGFGVPNLNNSAVNLNGKNVAVTINRNGSTRDDIPLSYVHYLRQAL